MEAGWVADRVPGPDFPPAVTAPIRTTRSGSSTATRPGIVVDAIDARYDPGDEILAAVYSGTVSSIPDFSYAVPSTATINTNQNRDNAITMNVTKNASFTGGRVDRARSRTGATLATRGARRSPRR